MKTASSNEIVERFRIEAKTGNGFQVKKGQRLRIVDLEGEQVADLVCFALHDPNEALTTPEKYTCLAVMFYTRTAATQC
jgi:uncharacterized protein YcgI (DUF1989 family)